MNILNAAIFLVFTGLLVIGSISTALRGVRYQRLGRRLPRLWWRDIALVGGLTLPFVLILAVRAFGMGDEVADQLWWAVLTGGMAIFGVAVYAYFELFVIEKHR